MKDRELNCIEQDSMSCYGRYATWASESILDLDPDLAISQLRELYEIYIKLYPKNYYVQHIGLHGETYYDNAINQYSQKILRRLESFQWVDLQIENTMDIMIKKYPHLSGNQDIRFILEQKDGRRAAHNK